MASFVRSRSQKKKTHVNNRYLRFTGTMSAEELKLLDELFESCQYQDSLDMIEKLTVS